MIGDIKRDDFSISIVSAKNINSQSSSSYFSLNLNQTYTAFTIETRSRLPMYGSINKTHTVLRRFSDFEYLLNKLREQPEYTNYVFPQLPEKRLYGNMDEKFIERRRVELEGFLRVLIQIDSRIKNDMNVNAFLTFEQEKYSEFRQNPSPFLDAMWKVYEQLPSQQSLKEA